MLRSSISPSPSESCHQMPLKRLSRMGIAELHFRMSSGVSAKMPIFFVTFNPALMLTISLFSGKEGTLDTAPRCWLRPEKKIAGEDSVAGNMPAGRSAQRLT